jgi:hypothetical protein
MDGDAHSDLTATERTWLTGAIWQELRRALGVTVLLLGECALFAWWVFTGTIQDRLAQVVNGGICALFTLYMLAYSARWLSLFARASREVRAGRIARADGMLAWQRNTYVAQVGGEAQFVLPAMKRALLPGRYRFAYLPRIHVLAGVEPIDPHPHLALTLRLAQAHDFSLEALAANRHGRVTPAQSFQRGSWILLSIGLAVLLVWIAGWLILAATEPISPAYPFINPHALNPIFVLIGSAVASALVTVIALVAWRRLLSDLRGRRPAVVEGHIRKVVRDQDVLPIYEYELNGRRFRVAKAAYEALDEALTYRVYSLPHSQLLLSIEPVERESVEPAITGGAPA